MEAKNEKKEKSAKSAAKGKASEKAKGKKPESKGKEKKHVAEGQDEPKSKRRKTPAKEIQVDEVAKALFIATLDECVQTHCTHPGFVHPGPITGVDFSPYWTRNTAGVKVERRFLNNKKAKGKGKAQIAYFGSGSPCPYASLAMAHTFVSRLQYGSTGTTWHWALLQKKTAYTSTTLSFTHSRVNKLM